MSQTPVSADENSKTKLQKFFDRGNIGDLVSFISTISTISAVSWAVAFDRQVLFPFMHVLTIYD